MTWLWSVRFQLLTVRRGTVLLSIPEPNLSPKQASEIKGLAQSILKEFPTKQVNKTPTLTEAQSHTYLLTSNFLYSVSYFLHFFFLCGAKRILAAQFILMQKQARSNRVLRGSGCNKLTAKIPWRVLIHGHNPLLMYSRTTSCHFCLFHAWVT